MKTTSCEADSVRLLTEASEGNLKDLAKVSFVADHTCKPSQGLIYSRFLWLSSFQLSSDLPEYLCQYLRNLFLSFLS